MKVAVINADPLEGDESSVFVADEVKAQLEDHVSVFSFSYDSLIALEKDEIIKFDSWVIIFPVQMDGLPFHLIQILVELEYVLSRINKKINVSAIALSRDREGVKGEAAVRMIENFANKNNLNFLKGISLGGRDLIPFMVKHHRIGFFAYEEAVFDIVESVVKEKNMKFTKVKPGFPAVLYDFLLKFENNKKSKRS